MKPTNEEIEITLRVLEWMEGLKLKLTYATDVTNALRMASALTSPCGQPAKVKEPVQ